jgi:hypothetical protein
VPLAFIAREEKQSEGYGGAQQPIFAQHGEHLH